MSISYWPPETEQLLAIDEYAAQEDNDQLNELVRGQVIPFFNVSFAQALVTTNIIWSLCKRQNEALGVVTVGGVGVITGRNPDTVREAKIAYYSYARNSREFLYNCRWEAIPDLVIENPCPEEPWSTVLGRTLDFLQAGVIVVAIVDFPARVLQVFRASRPPMTLTVNDELNLGKLIPESMPGCVIPVRELFED